MADCKDCGCIVSPWTASMVVLPNSIWDTIAKRKDLLCDECIEARLGRPLTLKDFPDEDVPVYKDTQLENCRHIVCNRLYFDRKGWTDAQK